MFHKA